MALHSCVDILGRFCLFAFVRCRTDYVPVLAQHEQLSWTKRRMFDHEIVLLYFD